MRWSRAMGLISLVLLLIPSFGIALAADVIYVSTDESYEPGDNVKVKGSTNVTGPVIVIITNSSGYKILSQPVDPEDGKFSVSFKLDDDASAGFYEVNATVGSIYNTTRFEVVEEPEGDDLDDETMTREELLSAIERAFRFVEKANATATTLKEEGYDIEPFLEKLNGLNVSLMELYEVCIALTGDTVPVDVVQDFHDLRNEISQLNGLLNSITKNVKEDKAKQFTERMMRRIDYLNGSVFELEALTEVGEFRSNLEAHKRKLERLWLTLNTTIGTDEVERILNELEGVTQDIDSGLDDLGDEGLSLKEMYKLQARIEVFNATVERMKERGKTMNRLQEKLVNADEQLNGAKQLMIQLMEEYNAKNWGKMKNIIDETSEDLKGVGKTIQEVNKSNKGGNGKSNGKGNGNGNGNN